MRECERCGRGGIGLIRGGLKFKDKKFVCTRCLKELGYDHLFSNAFYLSLKTSEEILHPEVVWARNWKETCERRAERLDITPKQYDALDKVPATEYEMKIFSRICAILEDEGCDYAALTILPGDAGSIMVFLGDVMIIEFKGEPQIKWIRLADDLETKIRFGHLSRLISLSDRIVSVFRENE